MKKSILAFVIIISALTGCTSNYADDKEVTLMLGDYNGQTERTGNYTGDLEDGLPNGVGVFKAVNIEGENYTYEGEFSNGKIEGNGVFTFESGYTRSGTFEDALLNGQGQIVFEDGTTYAGEFEKGNWKPTIYDLISTINSRAAISFNEKSQSFVSANLDLFPTSDVDSLTKYIDNSFEAKKILKTPDDYGDKLIALENLQIIQISSFLIDKNVPTSNVTSAILTDLDGYIYRVYFVGEVPDAYEGDFISQLHTLPLGVSSYENIGGTTTISIDLLCSNYKLK